MNPTARLEAADAVSLRPSLDALDAALRRTRDGESPEGPHGIRIATRRLDAWLRVAGVRVLRDDLRWLRRCAGELRELDVLLASSPPDKWLKQLRKQRKTAHGALLDAVDAPRTFGLLAGLRGQPPLPRSDFERAATALAARLLQAGDALLRKPVPDAADPDVSLALHDLRIRAKRLRYTMEWLGQETGSLRALQDALGALSDMDDRLRRADSGLDGAALDALREDVASGRAQALESAAGTWRRLRAELRRED